MASRPPRHTGDDRTLQLSAPALTAPMLEALLRYQERLVEALGTPEGGEVETSALARAHLEALASSGLEARQLEEVRSAVRRFVANRSTARRLEERMRTLVERPREAASDELVPKIREQLARLTAELGVRDRPETQALLLENEERLLGLHARLGRFG